MADTGFMIEKELANLGLKVNIQPTATSDKPLM